MGVDRTMVRFVLGARAAGVSFQKTVTLGRQHFSRGGVTEYWLQRQLAGHTLPVDENELPLQLHGYADSLWKLLGAESVESVDASSYEEASIIHDMNHAIPHSLRGQFTAVIDGGTIEHVFNPVMTIKNCMEMVAVGGHYLGITAANNYMGHGFYQFSPEWAFRVFSQENGFQLLAVMLAPVRFKKQKFYLVENPVSVGGRVELINNEPTYILMLARKIAERPIFEENLQQSDYKTRWDGGLCKDRFSNIETGTHQDEKRPVHTINYQQSENDTLQLHDNKSSAIRSWLLPLVPDALRWNGWLRSLLRYHLYEIFHVSDRPNWLLRSPREFKGAYFKRITCKKLAAGQFTYGV